MMNNKRPDAVFPIWLMPALSWAVSLYFGIDFLRRVGFSPDDTLLVKYALPAILWLFFLFLPFFSKVKLGKLLELERVLEQTQEEVAEFKAEVRNSLSVISTNVNTISGFSNQLTVNLPNPSEIREVRQDVENKSPNKLAERNKPDDLESLLQREDPALALAWTRIEIERLLRRILGKQVDVKKANSEELRFATLPQLFNLFTSKYPGYTFLNDAFRYVTRICNAAIHGQNVSEDQAREALGLGGQVVVILKSIVGEGTVIAQEAPGDITTE